ncbi:MAG: DUF423 domain-containing protein [Sandaracinaceae bacterium]|nr:DUF423 domain-containing protein [Sandaracinaceae bacterium]
MQRTFLALAGIVGALAVGLGAYGAHGLEAALDGAPDAARRLGWWQTAVTHHLAHAPMLAVVALVAARRPGKAILAAGVAFVLGLALFSGSLYAMTLGAPRVLGAVTPLGGLALIAGWLALALSALPRAE